MKKWTKTHFETIASVISTIDEEKQRERLAEQFTKEFKKTIEDFDTNRFRKSCAVRVLPNCTICDDNGTYIERGQEEECPPQCSGHEVDCKEGAD